MAENDRTFRTSTPTANRAGTPGREGVGDLGRGTPAGVDVHKLGQGDDPAEDWGEAVEAGTKHSTNHTRRPIKTEAERGQGAKTRQLNKDIVSRRR